MPQYNGARFLREALEFLCSQVFEDWTLLIGDNYSTDETPQICKELAARDRRINCIRRNKKLGPHANFIKLLEAADAEYFMWADCDDVWLPDYLRMCINNLDQHQEYRFTATTLVNIDSYGTVIREYSDFHKPAGKWGIATIVRFLNAPEIMGNANLIYDLYRLGICRDALRRSSLPNNFGGRRLFRPRSLEFLGRNHPFEASFLQAHRP